MLMKQWFQVASSLYTWDCCIYSLFLSLYIILAWQLETMLMLLLVDSRFLFGTEKKSSQSRLRIERDKSNLQWLLLNTITWQTWASTSRNLL